MGAVIRAVVGVVEIAVGVAVGNPVLIAAGIATEVGVVGSLLAPKPSGGGSQTKWKADPYAGMPYVMGRTLVAGNIVARLLKGDSNQYEGICTVLSIGPIQSVDTTFMNKTTMSWGSASPGTVKPAVGAFAGWIWQQETLGATPDRHRSHRLWQ